ncbi:saccharopine dehydrogenase family protein [Evansella cellulosilytica]|uniref:Saccharopine dehydrogenase n=1 Tax=Evansella cellulosilytica (strain ATCC 21833 / DSM 2522 / FERM P-1141 / JCM 9156 / N-4) TaxID=649639 RepID=E6TSL1_EVAC2|nr:saccharopine dehydrogenase NADP-binding domain-containing protein [Evansella cellulosilytica]ADU29519.1 Saccharopine dehydrogenase [Evansella cellulosilytica DSM 2522]
MLAGGGDTEQSLFIDKELHLTYMNMKRGLQMKNILVIGGYGQVGSVICKALSHFYPKKVMAAGRNIEKAKNFSLSMDGNVLPLELDIYHVDATDEVFQSTQLVIMCLDQKNTSFVEKCIQNKVNYIDISPSYKILSSIERLNTKAHKSGITIVLGVGLAPGLTNLMVKKIIAELDIVNKTDMYLMLGIGEKHGNDGVEWLLNNINDKYAITEHGHKRKVSSFTEGKHVDLPKQYGKRKAYRFNLADQHIISKTLEVENVSTRFFYDSAFTTNALAILKKIGVFKLLSYKHFKKMFVKIFVGTLHIFDKLNIGSEDYLVKAEVCGERKGKEVTIESVLFGSNNTAITGNVASIIAMKLIENKYASGVYYSEQLFELDEILSHLDEEILYTYEMKVVNEQVRGS